MSTPNIFDPDWVGGATDWDSSHSKAALTPRGGE